MPHLNSDNGSSFLDVPTVGRRRRRRRSLRCGLRRRRRGRGSLLIAASAVGHIKGEKGLFLLVKEFDNKAAPVLEPGKLLRLYFIF